MNQNKDAAILDCILTAIVAMRRSSVFVFSAVLSKNLKFSHMLGGRLLEVLPVEISMRRDDFTFPAHFQSL